MKQQNYKTLALVIGKKKVVVEGGVIFIFLLG